MENSQSDPAGNGQPAAANPDAANAGAASPPEAAAPPAQPAAAEDAPAAGPGVTDEPAPPQAAAVGGDAARGEATAAAPGVTEEAAPPQAVAAPAPEAVEPAESEPPEAEPAETGEPIVAVAAAASPAGRPRKRVLIGNVVSDKGNRTIVVSIARRKKHRLYKKYVTLTKKLKAHDPDHECRTGDLVRVIESRPLSREKRWRLVEIVKRAG